MYIHFTGYVLKNGVPSDTELLYTLSTESRFLHEMLDSYWTSFSKPGNYSLSHSQLYLMGDPDYYIYINELFIPVMFERLPYKRIQYPEEPLVYSIYYNLLKHWK